MSDRPRIERKTRAGRTPVKHLLARETAPAVAPHSLGGKLFLADSMRGYIARHVQVFEFFRLVPDIAAFLAVCLIVVGHECFPLF